LYYKDSAGVVQTIGTKGGVNGTSSGQVLFNSSGAIGGSNNLFWDITNGRLGIGTVSPAKQLEISNANEAKIGVTATGTNGRAYELISTGGSTGIGQGNLAFYDRTAAAVRMNIDSSGNVGIGTSSPASKFSIAISAGASTVQNLIGMYQFAGVDAATLRIAGYDYNSAAQTTIDFIQNSGTNFQSQIKFSTNTGGGLTEAMRITSAGLIGIGTSSPKLLEHIQGGYSSPATSGTTPNGTFLMDSSAGGYGLYAGIYGSGSFSPWFQSADKNGLGGYGSIVLNPLGGNVGIGTSSPSAKLSIASNGTACSNFSSADAADIFYVTANTGGSAGTAVYIMPIRTGSTQTFQGGIYWNGTIIAYNTTSDYRLKENIAPMTDALDTVAKLKPVTYKWKSNGSNGQGFIAHELQAVMPDCVTGEKDATSMQKYEISPAIAAEVDSDGKTIKEAVEAVMGEREVPDYQGIDTSFLVATLVAAIQELNAKVTALEAKG
jgi:hypothetical protein